MGIGGGLRIEASSQNQLRYQGKLHLSSERLGAVPRSSQVISVFSMPSLSLKYLPSLLSCQSKVYTYKNFIDDLHRQFSTPSARLR